jgi:Tol biopolymer transport system component
MDEDGSSQTPITPAELSARDPVWSPDGQWLSFVAWDGDHEEVFIIPAVGGQPVNITNHGEVDLGQSWSADSTHLAFESFRDNNWEIYSADISDPEKIHLDRLTNNLSNDHAAAWSHDGQTIAFLSDRESGEFNYAIWLMKPDGSNQARLTPAVDLLRPLSWSPDDKWLACLVGFGFNSQVFKINTLTGIFQQLSYNDFIVDYPVWRPDTWE